MPFDSVGSAECADRPRRRHERDLEIFRVIVVNGYVHLTGRERSKMKEKTVRERTDRRGR